MAEMAMQLVSEKLSNTRLRKNLRKQRAAHERILSEQRDAIKKLQTKVRELTKKLERTSAQIANKDEDLLELRTENASLTDRLKRARCGCQGGSGVRRCKK